MKTLRVIGFAAAAMLAFARIGHPQNSVVVESKTVVAGFRSVEVGIYLSNIPPVAIVVLPFEIREITPGSFGK